jgi:RNA recognition motif-containing protein
MSQEKVKLYVGSLPYDTTEEHLRALFAPFGNVISAKIIMNKDTGTSKGFGFVEIEGPGAGDKAIDALNQKQYENRTLVVSVARPPQDREEGGGGGWQKQRPRRDRY